MSRKGRAKRERYGAPFIAGAVPATWCVFEGRAYRVVVWSVAAGPKAVKVVYYACLEGMVNVVGLGIGPTEAIARLGYRLDELG